ncbi:MAG: acyltransferase [Sphingomonadales bacterium]|nr:MAG: acyltransferase [Sphingomonadales bacterium]
MLVALRTALQVELARLRAVWLTRVWGMHIGSDVRISGKAYLDFTNPSGVYIDDMTLIAPGARVLTHDFVGGYHHDTRIGARCFVGANAIILPGVRVGDQCIIAAGSVVSEDVPAHSMVAGNPARVLRSDLQLGRHGRTMASTIEAIEIEIAARKRI